MDDKKDKPKHTMGQDFFFGYVFYEIHIMLLSTGKLVKYLRLIGYAIQIIVFGL